MNNALVGFSGFVGGLLCKQATFSDFYRSTNIADIQGREFDTVVCAGAPAQKWLANKDPDNDRRNIDTLIEHLKSIRCRMFILISTVDVFQTPIGVDEQTPVEESGLHAYGLNRRRLEKCVEDYFPEHLIVRLPGLVGPGLRKNVIYDLLHNNNLSAIESRGMFQFYPMVNLWYDIQIALKAQLKLLHLTAEPISVSDIALNGFGKAFHNELNATPARYDFQTRHAALFGASERYQYSVRDTLQAVRAYAQSEPVQAEHGVGGTP